MAMVFQDRKSVYPNRYKVTPVSGEAYYVYLERADEPTAVGTPLNAETFNAMMEDLVQRTIDRLGGAIVAAEYEGEVVIDG